jgi:hypothetical protein
MDVGVPMLAPVILAQSAPAATPAPSQPTTSGGLEGVTSNLVAFVPNLIAAIAVLVIGWLIALAAAAIVKGVLSRTNLDNRLASWVTGRSDSAAAPQVEKWVSGAVFWLIFVLTLVAFLQTLQLTAVSQPLNNFLNQIIGFLPKIAGAAILLGVAWIIATITKLVVTRGLQAFRLDERLGQHVGDTPEANQFSLSETLGNTLYWFIFLLFLPAVLNTLELQGTLQPVQQLLNEILAILPNILAAIVIAAVGWLIAQVVRRIVTNLLIASGTDQIGSRFGLNQATGRQSLSWIIGTLVYVLVLIPTAIAALQALQIQAISAPAVSMLTQILNAIPQIFTAGLILVIAYVIGRFIADLVSNILTGIGFNNIFYWLGLQSTPYQPAPTPQPAPDAATPSPYDQGPPRYSQTPPEYGQPTTLQTTVPQVTTRTPSELIGIVVLVGIMLFAAVAAINILNISALTALFSGIIIILGRILAGLIVFAIGLYLANLAFNLITSSGTSQARLLGQTARIAIIALVTAMALQQMGIAPNIVNLAFGLLLGAIAIAIALAFGLGGRDIAAEQIRHWLSSFNENRQNRPPGAR